MFIYDYVKIKFKCIKNFKIFDVDINYRYFNYIYEIDRSFFFSELYNYMYMNYCC